MNDPIVLSQLRHAYEQLVNGHVRDDRAFADGMIAPLIRRLETDPTTDEALVERVARAICDAAWGHGSFEHGGFSSEAKEQARGQALAVIRAMGDSQ